MNQTQYTFGLQHVTASRVLAMQRKYVRPADGTTELLTWRKDKKVLDDLRLSLETGSLLETGDRLYASVLIGRLSPVAVYMLAEVIEADVLGGAK